MTVNASYAGSGLRRTLFSALHSLSFLVNYEPQLSPPSPLLLLYYYYYFYYYYCSDVSLDMRTSVTIITLLDEF
jgi:hypothetical protein